MKILFTTLILFAATLASGCSLLMTSDDEDVLAVAGNLLEGQKNEYGEQKKLHMPVRVNYSIARKPVVDQDLEIELEFMPEKQIPLLRLGMKSTDGLDIVSGEGGVQYRDLKPRQVFKKYVTVVPTEENEFYLDLYVVTESGEDRLAKHIKIPIALGEYSQYKK